VEVVQFLSLEPKFRGDKIFEKTPMAKVEKEKMVNRMRKMGAVPLGRVSAMVECQRW
jgi:hypothetical protein